MTCAYIVYTCALRSNQRQVAAHTCWLLGEDYVLLVYTPDVHFENQIWRRRLEWSYILLRRDDGRQCCYSLTGGRYLENNAEIRSLMVTSTHEDAAMKNFRCHLRPLMQRHPGTVQHDNARPHITRIYMRRLWGALWLLGVDTRDIEFSTINFVPLVCSMLSTIDMCCSIDVAIFCK